MSAINYKQKYEELKMKFMNSVDMAYRLGFEDGAKQQEMDQMQAQAQQQAEMEAAAMQAQGQEGAPGEEQPQEEPAPDSAHPDGSELDQHIAKLESMLGKSEDPEIRKSLNALVAFRKSQLQAIELKKSEKAIKGISKAIGRKPVVVSQKANHNLNDKAKKALSMQEQIVTDIMKSWADEEKKASKDIANILSVEGLLNKKE